MMGMKHLVCLLIFGLNVPLAAQEARRDYAVKLKSTLVTVEAQALTPDDRIIDGLGKEDFLLYEDQVPQEIAQFEQQKRPLAISLMIDTSGSMKVGNLWKARLIARQVISHLQADDEMALFDVGHKPELIHPTSRDRDTTLRALELLIQRKASIPDLARGNGIHVHDAVYEGTSYLKTAPEGKQRVIAVVTDNETTPPNSHSATETLHEALESDCVIVGLIVKQGIEVSISRFIHGDVKAYAKETGGEALSIQGGKELLKIPGLLDRLRVRYLLGYYPTNPPQDGRARKITLELSKSARNKYGKLKLIYRRRYYPVADLTNRSQ